MVSLDGTIQLIKQIMKAPPGLKPKRFGPNVGWDEQKRRWVTQSTPSGTMPLSDVGEIYVKEPAKKKPAKKEPEPAKKEPAKKEPAKKEPAKKEPAKKEPAKKEPAKKEPAKKEPAKKEPAKKEPAKKEPAKKEPAKKEPAKKEPAKKEPAKKEPAKKEPAKKEPAKKEPAKSTERKTPKAPGVGDMVLYPSEEGAFPGRIISISGKNVTVHDEQIDEEVTVSRSTVQRFDMVKTPITENTSLFDLADEGWISSDYLRELSEMKTDSFIPEQSPSYVNQQEVPAIQAYVGFSYVNASMLTKKKLSNQEKKLVQGISEVSKSLGKQQVLYRGMVGRDFLHNEGQWQPGNTISLDAFTSTSRSPSTAMNFTSVDGILLEISAEADAEGVTLSNNDAPSNRQQDETILTFGQNMTILEEKDIWVQGELDIEKYTIFKCRVGSAGSSIKKQYLMQELQKAPPGPKPKRFGPDVIWDDQRRTWVLPPNKVKEVKSSKSSVRFGDEPSITAVEPDRTGKIVLPGDRDEANHVYRRKWNMYLDTQDYWAMGRHIARYYEYEYKELNASLREGTELTQADQETFYAMKKAMSPLQQDYLVFRGWRNDPSFARPEVGQVLTSIQFTSTTVNPHYGVQWASYNSSTGEVNPDNPLWQIRVPKGSMGLMAHDYETELTLDTGTQFKCVGVRQGLVESQGGSGFYYMRDIYDMEVVNA